MGEKKIITTIKTNNDDDDENNKNHKHKYRLKTIRKSFQKKP